jgi:hypothetical protein
MIAHVVIGTSTAGDNTLVAGITGNKIQVIQFGVNAEASQKIQFKSGATAITGQIEVNNDFWVSASAPVSSYQTINHIIETSSGQSLIINLTQAKYVGGFLSYRIVPDTM